MSDPIERMNRLRSEVEGGTMLPAAEVRRLGDRRRRRRTAAISVAAAVAVAAIAVPIAGLTTGGTSNDSPVDPAEPPSSTAPADTATLTGANLLRDEDTVFTDEFPWESGSTQEGESDPPPTCQESAIGELGAIATFERTWFFDSGIHSLAQVAAEFPSSADARAAYDDIAGWLANCPSLAPENAYDATVSDVAIPVEGEAQFVVATYDLDPDGTAEQGGEAYYQVEAHTGLVVTGDRLTLLTQRMPQPQGIDYGFGDPLPVEQMLPTAAERLVEGESAGGTDPSDGATDPSSTGTTPADPVLTEALLVSPDQLPLRDAELDPWRQLPTRAIPTLSCQGDWLRGLGPQERLTAEYGASHPQADYDSLRLNVAILQFADLAAAEVAFDTVMGWLENCPATHHDREVTLSTTVTHGVEPSTSAEVDRSDQAVAESFASEVCPDGGCDAIWFDRQYVVQADDRLVLISYNEIAGPCPPTPDCVVESPDYSAWDDRVATAVGRTVDAALSDR